MPKTKVFPTAGRESASADMAQVYGLLRKPALSSKSDTRAAFSPTIRHLRLVETYSLGEMFFEQQNRNGRRFDQWRFDANRFIFHGADRTAIGFRWRSI